MAQATGFDFLELGDLQKKVYANQTLGMESDRVRAAAAVVARARRELLLKAQGTPQGVLRNLDLVLGSLDKDVLKSLKAEKLLHNGYSQGKSLVKAVGGEKVSGLGGLSSTLDLNSLGLAVEGLGSIQQIAGASEALKDSIKGRLEVSLALGEGTTQAMARVFGAEGAPSEQPFRVARIRAERLARTITNELVNEGKTLAYKHFSEANPQLQTLVEWVNVTDFRTSDTCRALVGQKRPVGEAFVGGGFSGLRPPAHPNCRSTIVPLLSLVPKAQAAPPPAAKAQAAPPPAAKAQAAPPPAAKAKDAPAPPAGDDADLIAELSDFLAPAAKAKATKAPAAKAPAAKAPAAKAKATKATAAKAKATKAKATKAKATKAPDAGLAAFSQSYREPSVNSSPQKHDALLQPVVIGPKAPTDAKLTALRPGKTLPKDPGNLKVVRPLGGGTGTELVEDASGNRYVRKRGKSEDQLREDLAADQLYRSLGVQTPNGGLYTDAQGLFKLTEFVEGTQYADLNPKAKAYADSQLRAGFAADAVLGNRDVLGANGDKVIVSKDGAVFRVNNGGALRLGEQGAPKTGTEFNEYPTEIWSMRAPDKSLGVFKDMDPWDVFAQLRGLKTPDLSALPDSLRGTLETRFKEAQRVGAIGKTFQDDAWNSEYTDSFAKHTMGLRESGVVGSMPEELRGAEDVVVMEADGDIATLTAHRPRLEDENGKLFDDLRSQAGAAERLDSYMAANGGDYEVILDYAGHQGSGSWTRRAAGLKKYLTLQRDVPESNYYWGGLDDAFFATGIRQFPQSPGVIKESVVQYHAYTYEMLQKISFNGEPRKDRIKLFRTESDRTVRRYDLRVGDPPKTFLRGGLESGSLVMPIRAEAGPNVTVTDTPKHRVFMTYLSTRYSDGDLLLGDQENEAVILFEGLKSTYVGTLV